VETEMKDMFSNVGFDMSFGPFGSVSGDDTVIPIAVMGAIGLGALGFGISKAVNDSREKKQTIEATNQLLQLADKALQQPVAEQQPVVEQATQQQVVQAAQPVTQVEDDDQEREEFIADLKNDILKELKGSVLSELKGSLVKELQGTLVREMQKEMQNIGKTISAQKQAAQPQQKPQQKQPVVQQQATQQPQVVVQPQPQVVVQQQPVQQPQQVTQPTVAQPQPQQTTQQPVQQQKQPQATINSIPFLNPYGGYYNQFYTPYGRGPMYK
jgi:hypothetical protein